jgi:hypothetical protein
LITNEITKILTQNGDERIALNEAGLNYQNLPPLSTNTILNRGTCTCSFSDYNQIKNIKNLILDHPTNLFHKTLSNQLKEVLAIEQNYEIYFAPSGTDLCYYPILFNCILNGYEKKLLNIVTNIDELGGGFQKAYKGKLFFNQNDLIQKLGLPNITDLSENISTKFISSRTNLGEVKAKNNLIVDEIEENYKNHNLIVNLNICSKSGIADDLEILEDLKHYANKLVVVDCCQFRNDRDQINDLLANDCMVMITGSKFFGAPPFCAALLVPQKIQNQIIEKSKSHVIPDFFSRIFSKEMLPDTLPFLQNQLYSINCNGLYARWNIAIDVMKKYFELSTKTNEIIDEWNHIINNFLQNNNEVFEVMPVCIRNFNSIVSFRIKSPVSQEYYSKEMLTEVRNSLVLEDAMFQNQNVKVSIGQPVEFENGAFLRVAIGAKNIIDIIEKQDSFDTDIFILQQIKDKVYQLANISYNA